MKRIRDTLIVLVAIELVATRFLTGDNIWYVDDILDSIRVIALCVLLASFAKRTYSTWCVIVAYGTCELIETASNVLWYWFEIFNPHLDALRVGVAAVAICYYLFRRYSIPSSPKPYRDDVIYLVYHKPNRLQDRALALFGRPLGGVGAYARGNWYHYSAGQFIVSARQPNKNHVIIAERTYDDNVIQRLNDLVGTRWGFLNNCMTEVWPVVKYRSRLPFLPKPRNF